MRNFFIEIHKFLQHIFQHIVSKNCVLKMFSFLVWEAVILEDVLPQICDWVQPPALPFSIGH
jgi:hypothetical protein